MNERALQRLALRLARLPKRTDVEKLLSAEAPGLWSNLQTELRLPQAAVWGWTQNHDENAAAPILAAPVLRALQHHVGMSSRGKGVHSGLMHTYGYLLSTLRTPYGLKRSRWTNGKLARALGLPSDALGPFPSQGTFFGNVTALLSEVALRRPKRGRHRLEIFECITTTVVRGSAVWSFWTDFCALPFPTRETGVLVVYSCRSSIEKKVRILTGFPTSRARASVLISELQHSNPSVPRFNAYLPDHGRPPE